MTRQHVKKGSRRETFNRKSPGRLHVARYTEWSPVSKPFITLLPLTAFPQPGRVWGVPGDFYFSDVPF